MATSYFYYYISIFKRLLLENTDWNRSKHLLNLSSEKSITLGFLKSKVKLRSVWI